MQNVFRIGMDVYCMDHQQAIDIVQQRVRAMFAQAADEKLVYHNLAHTVTVVQHAVEMLEFYQLGAQGRFIVLAAAWFHDSAFLFSGPTYHELKSVAIMQEELTALQVPFDIIAQVAGCILATRRINTPASLTAQILCDADTYHFGTPDFQRTDPLVRREIEHQSGQTIKTWDEHTLAMLQQHAFYTDYCKNRLSAGKRENIRWLEHRIRQE